MFGKHLLESEDIIKRIFRLLFFQKRLWWSEIIYKKRKANKNMLLLPRPFNHLGFLGRNFLPLLYLECAELFTQTPELYCPFKKLTIGFELEEVLHEISQTQRLRGKLDEEYFIIKWNQMGFVNMLGLWTYNVNIFKIQSQSWPTNILFWTDEG